MKDYLLFIDTEASGLPKKWDLPYSVPGNWPHSVQISWIIYNKEGEKIKVQNYYINDNDFEISASALRIHGLNKSFLQQHGIPRSKLLSILTSDLLEFKPMVVGHFMELDFHIIGVDYYREGLENPLEKLSSFCIMLASRHLQNNPHCKYLRLGDLYELLFRQPLLFQHNAMTDASATAECFFELVKRNEIKSFTQPAIGFHKSKKEPIPTGWIIIMVVGLIVALLIAIFYG